MTKQEFINKLLDCSEMLRRLAEHLESLDWETSDTENCDSAVDIAETSAETDIEAVAEIEIAAEAVETENAVEAATPVSAPENTAPADGSSVQASRDNPFARLFSGLNQNAPNIPAAANPFNLLNMLAGGKGGGLGNLGGLGSLGGLGGLGGMNLPTTLAELHDNPQIMNILNQVAANPQSLNMLSNLTGQSPETLQAALGALQPAAATPAAPPPTAPVAAAPPVTQMPQPMPIASAAPQMATMENMSATAHLDSLLAEWHWSPYARVWTR